MALTLGNKIIAGSFKSGASWEVGDVGISAFGIDESLNKRRYLNGQVISQAQFVQFTAFLKSRVSVYPSLATSEVNWQAAITNSDLGQCGQFVIDDVASTIRLPKVVNIQGLQDLAVLGGIKAESLPNITGIVNSPGIEGVAASGVFQSTGKVGTTYTHSTASGTAANGFDFDASRSSSTYQDNAPVQQEAVQYPYFIQVAEGVETSIDVSREIELNNPFSLFDFRFSDQILNNTSWLRADTFSWASGAVYVSAYEHLVADITGITAETETIGGYTVTFYRAADGHKICLADQETIVNDIFTTTGVAWYYILDIANQRFKLPRTKFGFTGLRDNVGNYVPESLPNIRGKVRNGSVNQQSYSWAMNGDGAFFNNYTSTQSKATTAGSQVNCGVDFDASLSSPTYQDNAPVQERATQMYLYFYVGQYSQTATEQTAGLNASLFNGKADVDLGNLSQTGLTRINNWIANKFYSSGVQNLTKYEDIASSTTTYTAPIDGFIRVKIGATYSWQLYINGEVFQEQSRNDSDSCVTTWVVIPVLRGDVLTRSGSTYHFDGGAMWYFS